MEPLHQSAVRNRLTQWGLVEYIHWFARYRVDALIYLVIYRLSTFRDLYRMYTLCGSMQGRFSVDHVLLWLDPRAILMSPLNSPLGTTPIDYLPVRDAPPDFDTVGLALLLFAMYFCNHHIGTRPDVIHSPVLSSLPARTLLWCLHTSFANSLPHERESTVWIGLGVVRSLPQSSKGDGVSVDCYVSWLAF